MTIDLEDTGTVMIISYLVINIILSKFIIFKKKL